MKSRRGRLAAAESEAGVDEAALELEGSERKSLEELLAGLPDKLREALALGLGGLALFALVATVTYHYGSAQYGGSDAHGTGLLGGGEPPLANLCGKVGRAYAGMFLYLLGKASYLLHAFLLHFAVVLFLGRTVRQVVQKVLGVLILCAAVAIVLAMIRGAGSESDSAPTGVGGVVGGVLGPRMLAAYGVSGSAILITVVLAASFLMATDWLLYAGMRRLLGRLRARSGGVATAPEATVAADPDAPSASEEAGQVDEPQPRRRRQRRRERDQDQAAAAAAEPVADPVEPVPVGPVPDEPVVEVQPAPRRPLVIRKRIERKPSANSPAEPGTYSFPSLEIFKPPRAQQDTPASRERMEGNARAIESKLESFKIGARVVEVSPGPAVTQYELQLDEGIPMRRILAYEPDLAAALKAIAVRVVAPIPGKSTVGVEVPNLRREMVVFRELLELQGVGNADQSLPVFIGKDVAGAPLIEDLARMPHLLIAGATGSGKSVCINSILLSLLMTKTPEQVRLILIDPKMVELQLFKAIPHLLCPVVTNMKKAPGALEWCVEKMEERYDLFAKAGVNHITLYNRLGERKLKERLGDDFRPGETPTHLPFVVLIIDELADLMGVAQQEVEGSIQRLAQKSRAVGLHVILATQSPRRDVVTGIIKANLPCKIAFKVSNKIDSRVILDSNGAEKLLGHGDLLYIPPGSHRLVRAQGTFVDDDEIRGVVEHLAEHCSPARFEPALLSGARADKRGQDQDDMYDEAVRVVLGQQRGSATLLQRALNVGYTRASRLLELMEQDGLVGPFVGSKSREVYLTLEEWESDRAAAAEAHRLGVDRQPPQVVTEPEAEDEVEPPTEAEASS